MLQPDVIIIGLPSDIGNLQSLTELDCYKCKSLKTIPDEISKLQKLKELNLANTAMTGLPKMDGCSALTDLKLDSCKKLTAEGLAEFCANPPAALQKLNLSSTRLKSLPKMDGCSSLTDLYLKDCFALTAEGLAEFCTNSPPALQKLNLYQANLETVPDSISKLQNLKALDLSAIDITGLPKMDGCESLTDLSLLSCKKLTAEGLAEFCAQPPPALQKLECTYCYSLKIDKSQLQAQLPNCEISGLHDSDSDY